MKQRAAAPTPGRATPARGAVALPAVGEAAQIHEAARFGTGGAGGPLPYLDRIQRSFGAHDLSDVVAHVGSRASAGARAMGASAYTFGRHIAFAGAPNLHVAAHEAAHAVQQRRGVHVPGGVGAEGDAYERQAEEVAQTVVRGGSAEGLLGAAARGPGPAEAVQRYLSPSDLPSFRGLPSDARIGEDGGVLLLGKQELIATANRIAEANEALEDSSKVMLGAGEQADVSFEMPPDEDGFATIVFDDYFYVRPRMNPKFVDDDLYESGLSPSMDDSVEEIASKHERYMGMLRTVESDFAKFIKDIDDSWYFPSKDSVAEANRWVQKSSMRTDLLMSHVALAFFPYQNEHKSTKLLLADLREVQEGLHAFVEGEAEKEDAIILPNDCAQCVSEMVGDQSRRSRDQDLYHAPEIGSNYYTSLPTPKRAQTGWNFHWAGVIMKDGTDRVTLESAGGMSFGGKDKGTWWFNLYGTRVADQTFKKQIHKIHLERNLKTLTKDPKTKQDYIDIDFMSRELLGLDDKFQ